MNALVSGIVGYMRMAPVVGVVLSRITPALEASLTGLGEGDFAIVDGTLIPTDRIRADGPTAR